MRLFSHRRGVRAALILSMTLVLGGVSACATAVQTRPGRTATEQLLVAHAAERAASDFRIEAPDGSLVFLDTVNFTGEWAPYAASALRQRILNSGLRLSPNRTEADVIVEVRMGALSIDQMSRVLGVPALTLPTGNNYSTFTVPELSLYSQAERSGVAEFSIFAYDARTGAAVPVAHRISGETQMRSHKFLMVMTWGKQEVKPGDPTLDAEPWWKPW
ncbi:DUF6655 family protein [Phenylobacterium sp.]|uniref:DUF6655 family protein n=1 Tax=Phenylobacterium sp. TaxID=1871053 RepID=UPI002731286D|nr:DUF6655 family protein [Phenylobacterium sp.]MDP1616229.1 hypothetical protein [Phenylobacterium sp.]MDP1985775.1 hypothetical protein [Phenylobacterium sp.]